MRSSCWIISSRVIFLDKPCSVSCSWGCPIACGSIHLSGPSGPIRMRRQHYTEITAVVMSSVCKESYHNKWCNAGFHFSERCSEPPLWMQLSPPQAWQQDMALPTSWTHSTRGRQWGARNVSGAGLRSETESLVWQKCSDSIDETLMYFLFI